MLQVRGALLLQGVALEHCTALCVLRCALKAVSVVAKHLVDGGAAPTRRLLGSAAWGTSLNGRSAVARAVVL